MTKGQTEFLIAISGILLGVGVVGTVIKINHDLPESVKPISGPIILQNGPSTPTPTPTSTLTPTPTPTSTPTSTPTKVSCNVLTDIHVNMYQATVLKLCGEPDLKDTNSPEVQRIEKIFKADEIWYYLASKASVEITDGWVTKVSPVIPTELPIGK